MRFLTAKWVLTCVAAASLFSISAETSIAGLIIDSYYQQVGVNGYYPDGANYNESTFTGPLSTLAVSGSATITSSIASATTIGMSYTLGLDVDTKGNAFALQLVDFHVDADTAYTFSISAYPAQGSYDYNVGGIYSYTAGQYEFYHYVTDGSGFTVTGVLHAGEQYQYISQTQPIFDQAFSGEITGRSSLTAVPEPSTFALAGLGSLALAAGACRRRHFQQITVTTNVI